MDRPDPELKPCRECGAPCRVEAFGPGGPLAQPVSLWCCSNHKRFDGNCPSDLVYLDAEAWNKRLPSESTMDAAARLLGAPDHRAFLTLSGESTAFNAVCQLIDENTELKKQRLMILSAVYSEAPKFVAKICDETLDRSGALLGQVREMARAVRGNQ